MVSRSASGRAGFPKLKTKWRTEEGIDNETMAMVKLTRKLNCRYGGSMNPSNRCEGIRPAKRVLQVEKGDVKG
jgi:hypothetical protein